MKKNDTEYCTAITEINHLIVVDLAGEMEEESIRRIMKTIMDKTYQVHAKGAVLNFALISVIDSRIFAALLEISKALLLMDVKVVWAGLTPGVVCGLMELNLFIMDKQIATALNLEHAYAILDD